MCNLYNKLYLFLSNMTKYIVQHLGVNLQGFGLLTHNIYNFFHYYCTHGDV